MTNCDETHALNTTTFIRTGAGAKAYLQTQACDAVQPLYASAIAAIVLTLVATVMVAVGEPPCAYPCCPARGDPSAAAAVVLPVLTRVVVLGALFTNLAASVYFKAMKQSVVGLLAAAAAEAGPAVHEAALTSKFVGGFVLQVMSAVLLALTLVLHSWASRVDPEKTAAARA